MAPKKTGEFLYFLCLLHLERKHTDNRQRPLSIICNFDSITTYH